MRTIEEIDAEIKSVKDELANVKGSETEVYARIVGYYRSVRNWNRGKREEYGKRKMFEIADKGAKAIAKRAENVDLDESLFDAVNSAEESIVLKSPIEACSESEIAYYELFTRKTCPNCPPVKNFMSKIALSGSEYDVDSEAGFSRASELGIMSSPTVVFFDANGMEILRATNVSDLQKLFPCNMAKSA